MWRRLMKATTTHFMYLSRQSSLMMCPSSLLRLGVLSHTSSAALPSRCSLLKNWCISAKINWVRILRSVVKKHITYGVRIILHGIQMCVRDASHCGYCLAGPVQGWISHSVVSRCFAVYVIQFCVHDQFNVINFWFDFAELNKCISNVPNPSITIQVWGSKWCMWNIITIHKLYLICETL